MKKKKKKKLSEKNKLSLKKKMYLSIWLHQVLVAACRILVFIVAFELLGVACGI